MENNSLVSVVIVNWNRKDDLKECIQSIIDQTYKNIEIIIVDNHSIDGSIEMVEDEFPSIKLIIMPNSLYGACETYNLGFANSVGEFIVIMDNDASLQKDWIENAIKIFKEETNLACIAGRVLNYYTKKDWGFWVYGYNNSNNELHTKEFYTTVFVGCSAIIRKNVVDMLGGYPQEYFIYHNEYALGAKIVNSGHTIKYCPNLIAYHKVSSTQRISKKGFYYGTRNWLLYKWTYYPLSIAVGHTIIFMAYSFTTSIIEIKSPLTWLRALIDLLKKIPYILKNRNPIKNKDIFKPKIW